MNLHRLGYCLALLFALVVFYLPWLTNRQSFYLSDITYFYEPFCRLLGQALKTHQLPLWNSFCYSGMPQIAVLAPGIFYPPNWLFALLPFSMAMAVFMVLHQFAAGLGAYLLIASFGWGSLPAAVGATSLALCGYFFSLQKNFSLVASIAWLPLAIWTMAKVESKSAATRWLATFAASLLIFLAITAGRPELSVPVFITIGFYVLLSALNAKRAKEGDSPYLRTFFLRILAISCGVLLSMPAILPAVEWLSLSPRQSGLSQIEALTWSANWYDCIALFLAQPLGDLNLIGMKHLGLVATRPGFIPFLSSAFVGPVVLTLAVWSAVDRSWKARWTILAISAVTMIAVLGNYTPIFPFMVKQLPLLTIFRYPIKLMIVPVICLILLASRGAFLACEKRVTMLARLSTWSLWAAVLTLGCFLSVFPELSAKLVSPHNSTVSTGLSLIGRAAIISAMIGLAVCLSARLYWSEKILPRTFALMLLATLTANLLTCAFTFSRHGADPDFFEQPSKLATKIKQFAKEDSDDQRYRILPLYFDPLAMPDWYHEKTLAGNNACVYQYGRQLLLPQTHMDSNLQSSFGYEAAETADYRSVFSNAFRKYRSYIESSGQQTKSQVYQALHPIAQFCRLTATRYVFTQACSDSKLPRELPRLDSTQFKLLDDDRQLNVRLYRVDRSLPRAYLRSQWQWCDSQKEAISLIESNSFDPASQLIIEHSSTYASQFDPQINIDKTAAVRGWLQFMQDNPEHISFSVRVSAPCFLVLADHYYPGWLAKVDGAMTQLFRANVFQRAVFIPAGSHLVEFDYDPVCLIDGLRLAILAISILTLMLAWVVFIKLAESVRTSAEG